MFKLAVSGSKSAAKNLSVFDCSEEVHSLGVLYYARKASDELKICKCLR